MDAMREGGIQLKGKRHKLQQLDQYHTAVATFRNRRDSQRQESTGNAGLQQFGNLGASSLTAHFEKRHDHLEVTVEIAH